MLRSYAKVWAHVLRMTWRMLPVLVVAMVAVQAVNVVAVAWVAIELRDALDSSQAGLAGAAVAGALGAAAGYAATAVLGGLTGNLRVLLVDRVGLTELAEQIQRDIASIEGIEHLESAEYLDRVTVVEGAGWGLADGLWAAVATVFNVLQLATCLVLLGEVSPWLFALLGFAAAPLWFDQRAQRAANRAEVASAEQFRLQSHLFDLCTSAVEGKEIRATGVGGYLVEAQSAAWRAALDGRVRARISGAAWKTVGWCVFTAAFVAALGLVVYRAAHGHSPLGDVVLTVTIAANLRQSVQNTVGRATAAAGAGRLVGPYLWLREYVAADRRKQAGTEPCPERLRSGIRLHHLTYTYPGTERPAVKDVSVDIPAGSVVGIVGEFGSGKTTLVKLLAKLYAPATGQIRVDGVDLARIGTDSWRERITCAFQDFGRFSIKAGECIGLGDPQAFDDRSRILSAVRLADAQALLDRLPQHLDTQLGSEFGGVQLSEGQWQKIALARASMRTEPLLMILDEPTASLDAPSEHAIYLHHMTRARELADRVGAITVIVSHRFSTISDADTILVMDQGELVEAGSHEHLMTLGGRYADLYSLQERAYAGAAASATGGSPHAGPRG